ncbi:undecaprenyl/decaprenyl-phosphate alpha-N-acetylglucosaminyl 1-phosphate transferase [Bacillus sp. CMF12]|uniref:glycosyltransferase family 4 protein n=1 Tax=Bacillaceae TaxID=186817 RepID=UPI001FB55F20|nr:MULTISPECIES: MraY family glycosyltransferase [Bacillaceae]UOE55135.1 undecaprenyl/decaprenyl-phosphate alpha-N-acetylglucosaminyl 1-phosphate transferase [Cytobacillus oceanisediminis]USK49593.1 undecaprenyl/decaprenyl-phosphate alpha-N-acetylglucosaminyl 1-phosphate transferase [Bacillus sp. CMF12]
MYIQAGIAFLVSLVTVLIATPFVQRFALKIGAVDKPNHRKVHQKLMPRLGGLAIFIGVIAGYFAGGVYNQKVTAISVGAILIVIIGILDDKYELSAKIKFAGQILVASLIVASGLTVDLLTIPYIGDFELGWWSYPVTIFWIVAITNAINLIDGLDGLSAGISAIGIATIAIMAGLSGAMLIFTFSAILLGSILGFLYYNFYPAKIFMGDTGALFLGYSISILSLLGLYKSVTLFSFLVPIIILGVPVFDTTFAILRRLVNNRPISAPDKSHLHHRLLALGLSHRNTVLAIYAFGILFSISAVLVSESTLWGTIFIIFGLLVVTEIIAELIGLVSDRYRPIINLYKKITGTRSLGRTGNK